MDTGKKSRYLPKFGKTGSMQLVKKLSAIKQCLLLPSSDLICDTATKLWPLLVPSNFLNRIEPGNLNDPLLQQFLPTAAELSSPGNYIADPLHESTYNPLPGLLHKYQDRVLILITNVCAIHCRYCFRRAFPHQQNSLTPARWQAIIQYLQQRPNIKEVILSGGDPLTLNNACLKQYLTDLAAIPHIDTYRIHSRIPIVLPSRINQALIKILTATRLAAILVTHCNHPNEIDRTVAAALTKFRHKNITLLNQTVLLKGINDAAEILIALSRKLFQHGILPYYLHMHDHVVGTAHFTVDTPTAKKIIAAVAAQLPGYLVPRLVRETVNAPAKCLV